MINALVVGVSRQIALRRSLDVIANNVANINTTGFRAIQVDFNEQVQDRARADAFARPDRSVSAVITAGQRLDSRAGPVERTGNPLDLAVRGDAFLSVQTPRGERFTRDGALAIDGQGRLVTAAGEPILGDGGAIVVGINATRIDIARDGTVSTQDGAVGKLKLTRFTDPSALSPDGGNVYAAFAAGTTATDAGVEAGALERSNVSAVTEMTRLVEVNRAYASATSAVERIDELRRTAIERLGADLRA